MSTSPYMHSPSPSYVDAPQTRYQPPYRQDPPKPYQQQGVYQPVQSGSPPPDFNRGLTRTPSPTPSEVDLMAGEKTFDLRKSLQPKKENIAFIIFFVVLLIVGIAFAILHDKIIEALQPELNWVHNLKGGWAIPLGLIIVMSFPPLIGSDFVSVLCGVIYGPAIGFAISGGGIFIGELLNYITFKYLCTARSEKMQKKNIKYACLAKVVKDGGLPVAIISRYSIIPSHVTTALFATCGMKLWVFVVSAISSLPKNFVNVYVGSTFEADAAGTATKATKLINIAVVAATIFITIFAMKFIDGRINAVKMEVIYERRKSRQAGSSSERLVSGSTNIPLEPQGVRYETSYNV